jgi:nitroreductase
VRRMDVMGAVLSRRSIGRLCEPAPDDKELLRLIEAAMTAPDHGLLRPWRLVLVRGEARQALGIAFAKEICSRNVKERRRAAAKPFHAPLLVSILFCPQKHHKIPEWEQLAATAAMVSTLSLLLHASGWGSMWRTGSAVRSPHVRDLLELAPGEQLLGWLYVGTPDLDRPLAPRPPLDPRTKISLLQVRADGRTGRCGMSPASYAEGSAP